MQLNKEEIMKAPVPSLSLSGWSANPRECLDLLVTHFFLSNASQSNIYRGNIASAQEILQRFSSDVSGAAAELERSLNSLLRNYYDDSSIAVASELNDVSKSASVVRFTLSGVAYDDNKPYQLNKLAEVKDGIFVKFIEINNG
jgi:hypothetical protein